MKTFSIRYVVQRPIADDDPRRQEGYTHEEPHLTAEGGTNKKLAEQAFDRICQGASVVSAMLVQYTYGEENNPKILREYKNPNF